MCLAFSTAHTSFLPLATEREKKQVFSDRSSTRTLSPACYNICDKDRRLINKRFDLYIIRDEGNERESAVALGGGRSSALELVQ
jgi:hypothetical protein